MNDQKAVLVTGAAGGIGRATCERLSRNGWRVLAVDRDAERLAWTKGVAQISSFVADISSESDNRRMAEAAEAQFGGLDAAVFNAAIRGDGSIDEMPFAEFQKVIAVNLFGPVLGIKATLPLLRRRRGAIAITSSTMGIAADADNWAYCASKHALVGLVRSLARELGCEGIRINTLCPGPTRTTGMTSIVETDYPEAYQHVMRSVPLQRWAEPDEMASVLEFLISPAASYVNGVALAADGGAMIGTGLVAPTAAPRVPHG